MTMKDNLRQVLSTICRNLRDITQGVEAMAFADNPNRLIAIFGQGYSAMKASGAVYVTRCTAVEVMPCCQENCTEEIPAIYNGTEICVDLISYAIKSARSPDHCNDVASPWYKLGGE